LTGLVNYQGISPQLLNLYDAALALNGSATSKLNHAGEQLAPTVQASSAAAAASPTFDVLDIVSAHADVLRMAQAGSGISTGESATGWSAWGQTFGGHASQDRRDQVDGYGADYVGLLLGADRAISGPWSLGGVVSYSNTSVGNTGDTAGDKTNINAFGVIGYADYVTGNWYAKLSLGVLEQHYDTERRIVFTGFSGSASGDFNGQQYVARGEVGYPIAMGATTVAPLGSLTYSHLGQDAYTESGGNGAALAVDSARTSSVTTDIGVKLEHGMTVSQGLLVPDLRIAWRHNYDSTRTAITANFAAATSGETSFTVLGATPLADSAVISAGITLLRGNDLSLTARYEAQLGQGYVSNAASLRLRLLF